MENGGEMVGNNKWGVEDKVEVEGVEEVESGGGGGKSGK